MSDQHVVTVSCVRHTYQDGTEVHLCGLDFSAERGRRVALIGPNGSGKTTLLFHVLGLLEPQEGSVEVFGKDPSRDWEEIRHRVGVVLQNVDEQLIAPTVFDDVAFSPRQYGVAEEEVGSAVREVLEALDIEDLARRVPHHLSGGEKRKVALAGALVIRPELLVLDEPFEGLDPRSRRSLIGIVNGLVAERGMTVIMATHDIDTVPEFADEVFVMAAGGEIVFRGTPAEVFSSAAHLRASNIRPPVLAELFQRLAERAPDAPEPALDIDQAVEALVRWRSHGTD
ncbi:MAG: ATP-binding cassette domain-containing protein [Coriobacteriia bacterium]